MGYRININVVAAKAVDFTDVPGVSLLVYHEGEAFSIATEVTDANGWDFIRIDRAHWVQTDVNRIKIYFEKAGYIKGCVLAHYDGKVVDGQDVHNHSFDARILLVEAEPEVLPPPIVEVP